MEQSTKWELGFVALVVILFGVVIVATVPTDYRVGGVPSSTTLAEQDPGKVIETHVEQLQYVFNITERGDVNGNYYNLIVAHQGDVLNLTMTAPLRDSATGNFYFPDYADQVVDDQIVPAMVSYDALSVPRIPGAYAFLDGEYDGPWYTYQVGLVLVLPQSGLYSPQELSAYVAQTDQAKASGLSGDNYNPPVVFYNSTSPNVVLATDPYGVFNSSVPGPTLVLRNGSTASITLYFAPPSPVHNYLVTYVNGRPVEVTNISVGIYGVESNGALVPLAQAPIVYGSPMHFTVDVDGQFPAYLYGLVKPVYNNYDPYNESSLLVGEDTGLVMGAWGVILVEG
ncbi:hypothetical protein GCM10007116_17100 [Sulfodiicoccus acidiphilus]|uniref:Oxidase n=1 Tax=Sulfodiicoccus acidiphilus TaxID=1670455 RepID=A0A830H547_9CREN|nr:oxidase [Sulfodiicoccus acidiphilus]GGU00456.1 hypothetical protein GCM10007116_17100 [Sulfodiicoccus acidiphilus]